MKYLSGSIASKPITLGYNDKEYSFAVEEVKRSLNLSKSWKTRARASLKAASSLPSMHRGKRSMLNLYISHIQTEGWHKIKFNKFSLMIPLIKMQKQTKL